jgi:hypothetical protein
LITGSEVQLQGTMIGVCQAAEAYANFGATGVVVAMLSFGLFFAVIDRMFNSENREGGNAVYLTAMVYTLNGIGTATTGLLFRVLQTVAASALVLRAFVPPVRRDIVALAPGKTKTG